MGTMINRRRVCGGSKKLPYDAEIEYLESSGTQYIDTGFILPVNVVYQISCAVMFLNINRTQQIYASNIDNYTKAGLINISGYINAYTKAGSSWSNTNIQVLDDTIYNTTYICNENSVFVEINGVQKEYATSTPYVIATGLKQYIFCTNGKGHANLEHSLIGRIYHLELIINGTVVQDFIPVRVGQVGYLYDKVSGQLFGNAGTGEFILGPDK